MKEILLPDDGPQDHDPDLEARLVALILGEASAFEAEALERLMRERPEVEVMKRRIEIIHGLVDSAVNDGNAGWKLSAPRRARVMKTLGIGNRDNGGNAARTIGGGGTREARIQRAGRRVLWAAAACVMINVVLFAWLIGKLATGERGGVAGTTVMSGEEHSIQLMHEAPADMERMDRKVVGVPPKGVPVVPSRKPSAPSGSATLGSKAPGRGADAASVAERGESSREGAGEALAKLRETLAMGNPAKAPEGPAPPDPFGSERSLDAEPGSAPRRDALARPLSSEMAKQIAATVPSAAPVPVPDVEMDPNLDFGNSEDFGAGWGNDGKRGREEAPADGPATEVAGLLPPKGGPSGPDAPELTLEDSGGLLPERSDERGSIVTGEVARRHATTGEAMELLGKGREAYAKGNYDEAVEKYQQSLNSLPGGFATESRRKAIEQHLADGMVAKSQQARRAGDYEEAREGLEQALKVEPENQYAKPELDLLDDPIKTNPAATYEHTEDIDKVRRSLYRAEGFSELGLHDDAINEYNNALRVDPYNTAARRGMEHIHQRKSDYYRSAYDETRARLLSEVDESWERTVPPGSKEEGESPGYDLGHSLGGTRTIENKLENIIIPELNLDDTTLDEAIDVIRQKVRELDNVELDPQKKGMNFVVRKPRIEGKALLDSELDAEGALSAPDPGQATIKELKLKNVSAKDALQYIAEQARMRYKVDDYAVTLVPLGFGEGEDVVTRRWKVPPSFVSSLDSGWDDGEADPFGGDEAGLGGRMLMARRPLKELLQESGIEFPPGTSVQYIPGSSTLVVSNTPANLDLVDQLTESVLASPAPPVDERLFRRRDGLEDPESASVTSIEAKLHNIIVPVVDFDQTTVRDAVDYLRSRSRELDNIELDPARKGLDFRIRKPKVDLTGTLDPDLDRVALGASDPGEAVVQELQLRNVPLGTVLQYICEQARLRYKIDENGITLLPLSFGGAEDLVTRSWEIHPDVMAKLRNWDDETGDDLDPFGDEPMTEREKAEARQAWMDRPLVEVLMESGVYFPPGASAQYRPDTGVLIVRNTPANQDLVDQLFEIVARDLSREVESKALHETSAREEPFSTFSLHVSDVSFKLAKATLEKGEWPAPGQIRVEDFVNAFDYGDPAPTRAEKVACRVEQAAHPFMQQRNLVRISMRTAAVGRAGGVPLSLTVLLDHSGSMERVDRAESVRRAFELLAGQLNAHDRVTLISFARSPRLLADRIAGNEAGTLAEMVAGTPSGGGTNLEEALRLGMAKAREQRIEGGQNRVILLTDGAANLGNAKPEDLARMVEEMRQAGIAFDACGVGAEGLNDEILESLTRKGDGRYYFLDRPEDADAGFARQIAGALRPAAKNVKVQVEFNPRRVGRYKLHGFEKHLLEKEDFRNDSVDAAEMAAEEAGNAVYHVEVLPDGEGAVGTVSVRFQDMESGRMVERRWVIPYEPTAPRLDEATPSMALAGAAALLGEKLNGSVIGERVRLDDLAQVVSPLQAAYPASERVRELVAMVAKAREVE